MGGQQLVNHRELYNGGKGGNPGRERGLSASALDQGRVNSHIRNQKEARNYSVGVHKNMMHDANAMHPS